MARAIFIAGRSGSGKSSGLRNLDPTETILINSDQKELPIPKFERSYNIENKNYIETSDSKLIKRVLLSANDNKKIKRAVIDTWSRIMDDAVMSEAFRNASDGRKAWGEMAADMYELFNFIKKDLRPDLKVYLLAHTESYYNDLGLTAERVTTQGQQLARFHPESFSTIVLYTHINVIPGEGPKYYFRTRTNGLDTCKSPLGMFKEELIENDLKLVEDKINEYYE